MQVSELKPAQEKFNLGYFWLSDMPSFSRLSILMITVFCRMSEFLDREAGAEDNARWDSDDDFEPPATPDGGWETVENVHVAGGADQVAATVGGNAGRGVGRGGGVQNAEEDGNGRGRGRGRGRGQVRVGWLPYAHLS